MTRVLGARDLRCFATIRVHEGGAGRMPRQFISLPVSQARIVGSSP